VPKDRQIVKFSAIFVSEHCASLGKTFFFQAILRILNDQISKTENQKKKNYSFQNIAQIFGARKWALFEWEGGVGLV